jgi:hypothetical protein
MTTTTPNMNLVLPDVLLTSGPEYANLINAAQSVIDAHDHSSGNGVRITPAGLNISSDLSFQQTSNATNLRTLRFYNNSSITIGAADKGCFYVLNNELYFIDGAGNSLQLTLGGAINLSGTVSLINIKDTKVYQHLSNLCNNDEKVIDYTIKFLARKLQKPYKLTNTALIFRSKEGCGKDSFFNWFGNKVLGRQYYLNEDKTELIFGRFNDCIENKIIVVINETSGQDTFKLVNTIKNAITRIINKIEYKGMTPFDNTNNIGFIFLTNNKNALKIDLEDRRFVAIECNNLIANNKDYFDDLYKEFDNDQIARAFYDYLMSIDCDKYDFTGNRPETDFYKNMQEQNVPIVAKFFEEQIYKYGKKEPVKTYKDLFGHYLNYLQEGNFKYEITKLKFAMELKEYEGITKKHSMNGVNYIIDFDKLKSYLILKKYILNEFLD